eukprot:TRINITY_DN102473_c0_g1_i1.p1 TRINITY_DN102473_c0_g1~~TRINITY_DN102473_c0_g1_i1.p1  ORF type:complete len:214 (-),score=37.90 TRINITY_DN102473_c0_g1_i1:75-716(-)
MADAMEVIRQHRRKSVSRNSSSAIPVNFGRANSRVISGEASGGPAAYSQDVQLFNAKEYLRPGISEAEVVEMKASFDLMDLAGEGEIDLDEALDDLNALNWDRLDQEPVVQALRTCRRQSNTCDFAGFLDAMCPLLLVHEPTQESLRRTWRLLDDQRKGSINMEDVASAVRSVGLDFSPEELADMVTYADHNGNGEITFDEFYVLLSRGRLSD